MGFFKKLFGLSDNPKEPKQQDIITPTKVSIPKYNLFYENSRQYADYAVTAMTPVITIEYSQLNIQIYAKQINESLEIIQSTTNPITFVKHSYGHFSETALYRQYTAIFSEQAIE